MNVCKPNGKDPGTNSIAHSSQVDIESFEGEEVPIVAMVDDGNPASAATAVRAIDECRGSEAHGRVTKLEAKKKKEMSDENKKQQAELGSVSIIKLFAYADSFDYLLVATGAVGAVAHGCGMPIFVWFFGKVLDALGSSLHTPSETAHIVNQVSLHLLYLGLLVWVASWAEVAAWMYTGERQAARIRIHYLQAVLKRDVGFFDTTARTGEIMDNISSNVLLVQDTISEKMGNFIHYTVTFVAAFVVAFSSLWKLGLVTLAILPAIAVAGGFYTYALTNLTSKSQEAYADAGCIAGQVFAQVRTVYSYVGEQNAVQTYITALQSTLKLGYRSGFAKGLGMGFTMSVLFCCWVVLFWYGGELVQKGEANGGKALSTIFAVIVGGMGLGQAMTNVTSFAKAKAGAYKLFAIIDHKSTVKLEMTGGKELGSVQGHLEFQNVEFCYPSRPDVHIFHNFSLAIPATKTMAIVGGSGSGKSTIVSLIERFYDPKTGEVLLDGINIKTLKLSWLRGQIGLVNQEPSLFATSIRENILYGKPHATQKEIEDACKASNAHGFISQFPQGYNTQVGERGVQMSGGQKQRIAIARAIINNPTILLLDEATSALDASSEQLVQEALDNVMVGRTTIVVAHRLSTIQNVDNIVVLQDGMIVESGNHDTLLKKNGAYNCLIKTQRKIESKDDALLTCDNLNLKDYTMGSTPMPKLCPSHPCNNLSYDLSDASEECDEENDFQPPATMWQLLNPNKSVWGYGFVGVIGSIITSLMIPGLAFITSGVFTAYYEPNHEHMKMEIKKYCLALGGLSGISLFGFFVQHFFFGIMSENIIKQVRELMFTSILKNEVSWFDSYENNSGKLSFSLAMDATALKGAIGDRISLLVENFTLMLAISIIAFTYQWKMTLVIFATFPLQVVATVVEQMFLKGFSGNVALAQGRANMVAGEAISNIRTIAAFNAEERAINLFSHELEAPMKRGFLRGQVAGIGFGISQMFLIGSYAVGLWFGGQLVKDGEANFRNIIKVFFVLIFSTFGIAQTIALAPDITKGQQALASVLSILNRHTKINADDPDAVIVEVVNGDIEFKDVNFSYATRPDVLIFKDLNLKVRAGKSLALVGASGCGKSSAISLIERFYDPSSGCILIDGKDIRNLNLKSLRRHVALVSQEPALFATTIYENILYGDECASHQEVFAAAKLASAHDFISALPEGYNTQVGEKGIQISGGQKQRIAIARAVLKNPSVWLLDEATSALDNNSEMIIQDALHRLMQGRTSVIVAQRLSTVWNADCIAVIQDGAIIEQGTHSELVVNSHGVYSKLINLQTAYK